MRVPSLETSMSDHALWAMALHHCWDIAILA